MRQAEQYGPIVAAHYSAYRPPLHQIILERVLDDDEPFAVGLDVGCGTGCSTVALAGHCHRVYGIDPSRSMLREATQHPRVAYLAGTAERIALAARSVDVATFAGSLFYADLEAAGVEVRRVCRNGAVVVYDFEALLGDVLAPFGLDRRAAPDYDHGANFSGVPGFTALSAGSERVRFQPTASELAHVLLSDLHRFEHFAGSYRVSDPFPPLLRDLQSNAAATAIAADIHYARYRTASA